jgi:hypothetical protein
MSGLHEAFDDIVADVPVYGDLDRAVEQSARDRRRRAGVIAGLAATAAAVAVIVGVLAVTRDGSDPPRPIGPTPTPSPTRTETARPATISRDPSEVLAVHQLGRKGLDVAGETVPGRWSLETSRRDVWVAGYSDEVGYTSSALWWGKGTTTHEVPGQRGGYAISQDAHWIVWTRAASGEYQDSQGPRVMEVVDTATGTVRWSRDADADAPEIAALAVTNDGVVVFGHCLEPFRDIIGTAQCDDARIDVWAPRFGVTSTVPAEVSVFHGPPGTVAALDPLVRATGAHNGLLVRDTPSGRPRYVRVTARGDVEVVATLPRDTLVVTADERFALLGCDGCGLSVLSLDGGERRRITSLAGLVGPPPYYSWPVYPYVVERADLVLVRDLTPPYPAVARCSLAQARCVRIEK